MIIQPTSSEWTDVQDELSRLREAIGLATTALPSMEVDASDPVGMMRRVVDEHRAVVAERDQLAANLASLEESIQELPPEIALMLLTYRAAEYDPGDETEVGDDND